MIPRMARALQLCAFDVLAMSGDDLRALLLSIRKTNLARLLAHSHTSSRAKSGPIYSAAACRMGLEGLASKHRDRPYRGGRQKFWVKVKNRSHPAMGREL